MMSTQPLLHAESPDTSNDQINTKLYMLAHDIKSPVAQVSGLLEIAKSMANNPDLEDILSKTIDSNNRLNHKIDQMLEFAKNTSQQSENIDLNQMVRSIVKMVKTRGCKKLRFNVRIEKNFVYNGNLMVMQSVLQNLIENAIKYCDFGKKFCLVDILITSAGQELIIKVSDNGLGIPTGKIPFIFHKSYKAGDQVNSHGLGLYLVKKNVEDMNGCISVISQSKKGSSFTIKLPLHANMSVLK